MNAISIVLFAVLVYTTCINANNSSENDQKFKCEVETIRNGLSKIKFSGLSDLSTFTSTEIYEIFTAKLREFTSDTNVTIITELDFLNFNVSTKIGGLLEKINEDVWNYNKTPLKNRKINYDKEINSLKRQFSEKRSAILYCKGICLENYFEIVGKVKENVVGHITSIISSDMVSQEQVDITRDSLSNIMKEASSSNASVGFFLEGFFRDCIDYLNSLVQQSTVEDLTMQQLLQYVKQALRKIPDNSSDLVSDFPNYEQRLLIQRYLNEIHIFIKNNLSSHYFPMISDILSIHEEILMKNLDSIGPTLIFDLFLKKIEIHYLSTYERNDFCFKFLNCRMMNSFDENFKYAQKSSSTIRQRDNDSTLVEVLTLSCLEPSDNNLQA